MQMKTAVFALSFISTAWFVLADPPTPQQQKAILDYHNKVRSEVNPPASNMKLMVSIFACQMNLLQVRFIIQLKTFICNTRLLENEIIIK